MGVKARADLGRSDPARELHERTGVLECDRGLLAQLTDRRRAVGVVAFALAGVHGASREHPHAAHEPSGGRALDQQHFERPCTTAQQDHGRRLTWGRGFPRVVLLSFSRAPVVVGAHLPTLPSWRGAGNLSPMTTTTLQRWICESCGYIYAPEEGDPDGGIPTGTAFEDIPDTWFCPVCGARKRDFVLYED